MNGWDLILFLAVTGVTCVAIEFFLPHMVLGVIGFFLLLGSCATAYARFGFKMGTLVAGAELLGLIVALCFWIRYLPDSFIGRLLSLNRQVVNRPEPPASLPTIGETGETVTPCRLSGSARIGGHRYDVISEIDFIPAGAGIKVVRVENNRIVVRKMES